LLVASSTEVVATGDLYPVSD